MMTSGAPNALRAVSASSRPWAVATRQPQRVRRTRRPSSTRGSLSMARTLSPSSGSPAPTGSGAPGSARTFGLARPSGAVTKNTDPLPGRDRNPIGCSSTRPRRSTIDKPRPRPGAARAPWSSRLNSANTTRSCSGAMPRPVSQTSMRAAPDIRRQPTSTRPLEVYLSAFEIRFCNRRRMRRRSVRMASVVGHEDEVEPLRPGEGGKIDLKHAHQIGDRNVRNLRRVAPASSREMSSSAPMISSTASSERSTLRARFLRSSEETWSTPSLSELA